MTPVLSLQGVSKQFEPGVSVLQDIDLQVDRGAIVCLLGPSGCGKTTLLRLIAGFEEPSAGEIYLSKQLVSHPGLVVPPERRCIGMVFQDYALFPHMTVAQNIQFGLFHWSSAQRRTRLLELLRLVGLEGLGKRYPHELSGGQQQRVALARALAPNPQLLLLDEPFSNLDVSLRQQLRDEVQSILVRADITTVLVTHDQEEALSLGDRLAVLERGSIVQYAAPDEVVQQPSTRFVAQFLALGHFITGQIQDRAIATEMGPVPLIPDVDLPPGQRQVEVLIRPECVRLSHAGGVPAQVVRASFRGTRRLYTLRLPSGTQVCGLFAQNNMIGAGDQIHVSFDPAEVVVFPRHTHVSEQLERPA
jgi:iron(III) transport system ATP-binding protein